MYIGEFARRAGTTAKAVRYYEDLGLLGGAERTESGYRHYGERDLERLRFIMGAKALGFSLEEIKSIVGLYDAGTRPCGEVSRMLGEKLAEMDRRIQELTTFRDELRAYKEALDAEADDPSTPCVHIAGAVRGVWNPSTSEPRINQVFS